jgi:hypothetical protein
MITVARKLRRAIDVVARDDDLPVAIQQSRTRIIGHIWRILPPSESLVRDYTERKIPTMSEVWLQTGIG